MNWKQKKRKTKRQRQKASKNAHRKWKRSILAAANEVVSELIGLVEKP